MNLFKKTCKEIKRIKCLVDSLTPIVDPQFFYFSFFQTLELHRTQPLPFCLIYVVGKYSEFYAVTSLIHLNKYVCPLELKT